MNRLLTSFGVLLFIYAGTLIFKSKHSDPSQSSPEQIAEQVFESQEIQQNESLPSRSVASVSDSVQVSPTSDLVDQDLQSIVAQEVLEALQNGFIQESEKEQYFTDRLALRRSISQMDYENQTDIEYSGEMTVESEGEAL